MSGGARERGFASEVVEADGSYEATARVVDPGRSEDDRVVEHAADPGPKRPEAQPALHAPAVSRSSRVSHACVTSSGWCSRRPAGAAGHRTTSCSRARPGWARPPWR